MALPVPAEFRRRLRGAVAEAEAGAPLPRQLRAHQAHGAAVGRGRVVEAPVFREQRQHSRLERHRQRRAAPAVGEEGIPLGSREDPGENHGDVGAAQEIPLAAAAGEEREFRLEAAAAVGLQVAEEEGEEFDVCGGWEFWGFRREFLEFQD